MVMDGEVVRFRKNKIVDFLLRTSKSDLNDLAMMDFSEEDHAQFAQLIGYSVSGWGDLSYVKHRDACRADDLANAFYLRSKRKGKSK